VLRVGYRGYHELRDLGAGVHLEVAGKRGINYLRFRGIKPDVTYTAFEDRPQFEEVEKLANKYIGMYLNHEIDRLDVASTRFVSTARQEAAVTTLLPMSAAQVGEASESVRKAHPADGSAPAPAQARHGEPVPYEFLPDARSILEELVPISFKIRLFKCFLDAAVSEQIARMVAMRGATENADQMVKTLTRLYNRARQSQITRELAEIVGGAAALE
jgi:F-type H+-transporting ATPase subunit gamma